MKKLLRGIVGVAVWAIVVPVALAAYNDVTLTTSAVLNVNGVTINVSGSSAVIQSITVNPTTFSFILGNGSTFQVSAPNRNQLSADTNTGSNGSACDSSQSFISFGWSQSGTETVTVTPSTTICGVTTNSGGGGGGGGGSSVPPPPFVTGSGGTPTYATTTPQAPSAPTAFFFSRNLKIGSKGNDVLALQRYLNTQLFLVAHSGSGSPGKETNYFGPATRGAVMKYQRYNHIAPVSGFFGPKTRGAVNAGP